MRRLGEAHRWLRQQPIGFQLYFWLWTALVPAGLALLFAGIVVPGLLLLGLFVVEQAIIVPLIAARSQKRPKS
jgi:hypothetical protein